MRLLLTTLVVAASLLVAPPALADDVANTAPPTVSGNPIYGEVLSSEPGSWTPAGVTFAHQWLRDGKRVAGATHRRYRLTAADLGHRMSVRVVATDADGHHATADSAPTRRVDRRRMVNRQRPVVEGVQRYGRTLSATSGRWSPAAGSVRYRWLRDGRAIRGATGRAYRIAPADVGHRLQVEVTATATGHHPATARSEPRGLVRHRRDVRRTVTYVVRTKGRISADVGEFARLAAQTYADPRGWRGRGVQFRRVRSGGSFTLVLAQASTLPSYSSGCSATWSCRVGRYVVINQTRWQNASPAWNAAGRSRRDYRHMVVNHETGHWLGKGHASCPGRGALAPVMMQQSKGTQGCRFNPWPTLRELG